MRTTKWNRWLKTAEFQLWPWSHPARKERADNVIISGLKEKRKQYDLDQIKKLNDFLTDSHIGKVRDKGHRLLKVRVSDPEKRRTLLKRQKHLSNQTLDISSSIPMLPETNKQNFVNWSLNWQKGLKKDKKWLSFEGKFVCSLSWKISLIIFSRQLPVIASSCHGCQHQSCV